MNSRWLPFRPQHPAPQPQMYERLFFRVPEKCSTCLPTDILWPLLCFVLMDLTMLHFSFKLGMKTAPFNTEPKGPVITPDIKDKGHVHLEDISSQCHLTQKKPTKNTLCVKFLNKQPQAPSGEPMSGWRYSFVASKSVCENSLITLHSWLSNKRGRGERVKGVSNYSHLSKRNEIAFPGVINQGAMKSANTLATFRSGLGWKSPRPRTPPAEGSRFGKNV